MKQLQGHKTSIASQCASLVTLLNCCYKYCVSSSLSCLGLPAAAFRPIALQGRIRGVSRNGQF